MILPSISHGSPCSNTSGHSIIPGTSFRRRPEFSVIYPSTRERHVCSGLRRSDEYTATGPIDAFDTSSQRLIRIIGGRDGESDAILGPRTVRPFERYTNSLRRHPRRQPFAATLAAAMGAEVIHIERPGEGDEWKSLTGPCGGSGLNRRTPRPAPVM